MGILLQPLAHLRGRFLDRMRARRVVVILDPKGGNLLGALKRSAAIGAWFVVLSVGYPQSPEQDEAVERTFNATAGVAVPVEAVLVPSRRAARKSLRWGDALLPAASTGVSSHV